MDTLAFRFWASLVSVGILAGIQVAYPWIERRFAGQLARLTAMAGGVAVGYVSLYLLPKIGDYTAATITGQPDAHELWQYRLYLIFLGGLVTYFFVDRAGVNGHSLPVWLHGVAFTLYSFATGCVLANVPRPGFFPYILAGATLGLHFIGICHQLRAWHREAFDRYMRWMMGIAVLAGWAAGSLGVFSSGVLATIVAFLGGGILVNVLREEWPDKTHGRTGPFLVGIGLFILLSWVIRTFSGGRI